MIVGAGIGLTPSSAILKSVCRHKWKKGWLPQTIYFYWVVRHEEIESFRWFIRVMVELERRVASDRYSGALGLDKYIEMNVYVTATPKKGGPFQPSKVCRVFLFIILGGLQGLIIVCTMNSSWISATFVRHLRSTWVMTWTLDLTKSVSRVPC